MATYFTQDEVQGLNSVLVSKLDMAREIAGVPFIISPGGGRREGDPGAHGDGDAVDLRVRDSRTRLLVVIALTAVGFKRVGVYDRHIHVDVSRRLPQEVMWVGKSK